MRHDGILDTEDTENTEGSKMHSVSNEHDTQRTWASLILFDEALCASTKFKNFNPRAR